MKENERFGKWGKLNKREKRFFLILAACLCLGILLMRGHGGNAVEAQSSAASQKADSSLPPAGLSSAGEGDQLEQELEELLCQVKGAGRVHVALRYADSAAAVYAYDESTRVTTGKIPLPGIRRPASWRSMISRFWSPPPAPGFRVWWWWRRVAETHWLRNACIRH